MPYARRASFVVLIIMSLLLSSCATIFKGGEQNIAFNSNPQGAEILIDGEPFGTTPQIIRLEVQRSYEVTLRQGSEERTITIRNRVGTQWVVLDVLGLLIPLLVDASTGDWYELSPDEVVVDFTEEGMTGHDSGE
ncbi:MAG: PEGA domain-containing protein [Deinococcota bacterium]